MTMVVVSKMLSFTLKNKLAKCSGQALVIPALVSFFTLSDRFCFFDFGPIFKCHAQRMEKYRIFQKLARH